MKKRTLFEAGFKGTIAPAIGDPHKPDFRPTQTKAFHALKDARHAILNAPTGWGKSLVMATLIQHKLLKNPNLRCIIAVPQTVIGEGFTRDWQLKVPGVRVRQDWLVQQDLCGKQARKVNELISFLSSKAMRGRVLLCTHDTLRDAYIKLKRSKQLRKLSDVLIWVDEAHHVKNAQAGKKTESNGLGELVRRLVASKSALVGLATATFMRGDMRHIVPDHLIDRFTRYDIPYDVYFEEQAPVELFTFNVICGNYLDGIEKLFRKKCPTIIYLAKRNSRHASDCKHTELKQIITRLGKALKAKPTRRDGLIYIGTLKVLDLVTMAGRERRKERLKEADIIIALDMCKEGFDWPKAERSIIIGERHSVPEMIQMIGRLFRWAPGKKLAEVYQILPMAVRDTAEFQDTRNDILTVIFSAMLLEDVFASKPVSGQRGPQLATMVANTDAWQRLVRDFHATLADAAKGGKITWKASLPFRKSLLNKHGIAENKHKETWEKLWATFARLTRSMQGHKVKDVPFRLLKNVDISEGLLKLSSGLCGKLTFKELRVILIGGRRTADQWLPVAERLAKDNRGFLPNVQWLCTNGYTGLSLMYRDNPEVFGHIPQESKLKTPQEWLVIAETLASANNGSIPAFSELRQRRLHGLERAIKTHGELFQHLKVARKYPICRTPHEWLDVAKQVAASNGGTLPGRRWLITNKLSGLEAAISKTPELFSSLPRHITHLSARDHMVTVRALAAKHGYLPCQAWLKNNGHGALAQAISGGRIQLPSNIIQDKKHKTPDEWYAIAKELVKTNNGYLPGKAWLTRNRYYGLIAHMAKPKYRRVFAAFNRYRPS